MPSLASTRGAPAAPGAGPGHDRVEHSGRGDGPVDEAIALINANRYGNGTAIFTASGEAARRFHRGVPVGPHTAQAHGATYDMPTAD